MENIKSPALSGYVSVQRQGGEKGEGLSCPRWLLWRQQQSGLEVEPGKVQIQEDFGSNLHKDDCCGTG